MKRSKESPNIKEEKVKNKTPVVEGGVVSVQEQPAVEPEILEADKDDFLGDEPEDGEGLSLESSDLVSGDGDIEQVDQETESKAPKSGELVRYDPFEAYLREIRAYPPLSREEEKELALRYYHNKDIEAAYKLVTSNLWLVVKIARDYEKAARSILDLIQEGNVGLMDAVKNFDPYRGVRFPSYAVWWIKAYIVRFIIANWRLVKIGTTQAQRKLFFNLRKEKERLEREGFFPAPKLLADKLNVRESDVIEMEQRLSSADVSVDTQVQPDSDATLLSILPAPGSSAEDLLGDKQVKTILEKGIEEFASTLNSKELIIFRQRMIAEEKATLQDLSDQLSISCERVRQIENRLREKLKEFLESKYGAAVHDMGF